MQRKILPGLRVLPTVQRKSNGTSWLHQQPVRPVNGRSLIQPKVKVHAANDRFEKEADHVADMVVGKSASPAPVRVSSVSKGAQRKPIAQAKKNNSTQD